MTSGDACGCYSKGEYIFILCKEHYDLVMTRLDGSPKVIPELVQLLQAIAILKEGR